MRDNTTSQPAAAYDANVAKTIPFYPLFLEQTLDLASVLQPTPLRWLECGCGTGNLVAQAIERFPRTRFTLADPASPMLELAKQKLTTAAEQCEFIQSASEDILLPSESFDLITAIMCHHYLPPEGRQRITENCFRLLAPGGAYINFETIRSSSQKALTIGLERWQQAQLAAGKSPEAVTKHIQRYGIELIPISIADHLSLLTQVGFSTVELFWTSYLQAGFYAIK